MIHLMRNALDIMKITMISCPNWFVPECTLFFRFKYITDATFHYKLQDHEEFKYDEILNDENINFSNEEVLACLYISLLDFISYQINCVFGG